MRPTVHGARVAIKESLRHRGVTPTKPSYVWHVVPSVVLMPAWAAKHAVKGLESDERSVWLRRRDAWMLAKIDREDGGRPSVVRFEFRVCQICKRVLLGQLATARRMLDESSWTGKQLPCGPDCIAKHWRNKGR